MPDINWLGLSLPIALFLGFRLLTARIMRMPMWARPDDASLARRVLLALASPLWSIVLSTVAATAVFLHYGVPTETGRPQILDVAPNKPAERAGLRSGDLILSVAGEATPTIMIVSPLIAKHSGAPFFVEIERDGKAEKVSVEAEEGRIGIQLISEIVFQPGVGRALGEGVATPWRVWHGVISAYTEIFAGKQRAEFAGPIGIVRAVQQQKTAAWRAGAITNIVHQVNLAQLILGGVIGLVMFFVLRRRKPDRARG